MVSRSLCEEIPKITSNLSILDAPLKPKRVVIFGSVHAVMSVTMLFYLCLSALMGAVKSTVFLQCCFNTRLKLALHKVLGVISINGPLTHHKWV